MSTIDHLIRGVATGNRGDFVTLYRSLQSEMLRYAIGILAGDRSSAEDAVDEAFTAVWQQASRYTGQGNGEGWIRRIVRNKAIDIARRNRESYLDPHSDDLLTNTISEERSPLDHAEASSQRKWIAKAMELLSLEHREVLWLCYFQEEPLSKIAIIMGCPENTVKTRLFHARLKIKAYLEQENFFA